MQRDADELSLAAEFPAATHEQWRKLVDSVLKGAPFEKLQSRSADGLTIEPLYPRAADAAPIAGRAGGTRWQVMQRIDHPDPHASNAEVLHELDNGADGLVLIPAGAIGAHGYGLAPGADAVERALAGVHLDAGITIALEFSPQAPELPLTLAGLVKRQGLSPAAVDIRFGLDPLGAFALHGRSSGPWRERPPRIAAIVSDLSKRGFKGPFATADGRVVHDAGGSEAQELAFVLAAAVAYLRAFEAGGIALDAARRMIAFRLTADADQFLTIVKFRALRRLWQRVRRELRADARARDDRCRDRVALADSRRRLCEHPARDDRRVFGRSRRRRCDHGQAIHCRARPERPFRAARCPQYAARAA